MVYFLSPYATHHWNTATSNANKQNLVVWKVLPVSKEKFSLEATTHLALNSLTKRQPSSSTSTAFTSHVSNGLQWVSNAFTEANVRLGSVETLKCRFTLATQNITQKRSVFKLVYICSMFRFIARRQCWNIVTQDYRSHWNHNTEMFCVLTETVFCDLNLRS
jgi:hypothetical protein